MDFSIWFTSISIFLVILLAVFKFDEWEILKLKSAPKYFVISFALLIMSGISAYFESYPYPKILSCFWNNNGLYARTWSIIWIFLFIVSIILIWKWIINKKPTTVLIKKYCDYLETMESAKFSSLFRKYEKYFFNIKLENAWNYYEPILKKKEWWSIIPYHFKEIIFKKPEKFYKLNINVLETLLSNQIEEIPNSLISKEIELLNEQSELSEETPILKIFLTNPSFIAKLRDKGIFLPIIKKYAELYFTSLQFKETDHKQLELAPSFIEYNNTIPRKLTLFYYIKIIDIYWIQVMKTGAEVSGFYFYDTWLDYMLSDAPQLENTVKEEISNHYLLAVKKQFENISNWINFFLQQETSGENMIWNYCDHFIELKEQMLKSIHEKFLNKVDVSWYTDKVSEFYKEIINVHKVSSDKLNVYYKEIFSSKHWNNAFKKLSDTHYFSDKEKEDENYIWLKKLLKIED